MNSTAPTLAWWRSQEIAPSCDESDIKRGLEYVLDPCCIVDLDGKPAVVQGGRFLDEHQTGAFPILGWSPACPPQSLGDVGFLADHGLRFPIVAGAMYHGISSEAMVCAMGRKGMLGVFGAGGLGPDRVEQAISNIQAKLPDGPYGFNLLNSPYEPELEAKTVELFLKHAVRLISASAYVDMTLPLIRYRLAGIRRLPDGTVDCPNRVIAKLSREEVAKKFWAPAPEALVAELVRQGHLSREQAELAAQVPVAQDVTAEADSGGHTDQQPFMTMVPTMIAIKDKCQDNYSYQMPLRLGAGGGIGTPQACAGAFTMGCAYVVTGSINQSCVEAGVSDVVRDMLCQARQADVTLAPAADMFEMGAKVQVLKRGTMFPMRAVKLYELYRSLPSLEALDATQRAALERDCFKASIDDIWQQTRQFFSKRDPKQLDKATRDPKHRMALVFRWYLGQSSIWAERGVSERRIDFQVQCGPSMGAFNEWVRGSVLEEKEARDVASVSMNLLVGASVMLRLANLRTQGVVFPERVSRYTPVRSSELEEQLGF